ASAIVMSAAPAATSPRTARADQAGGGISRSARIKGIGSAVRRRNSHSPSRATRDIVGQHIGWTARGRGAVSGAPALARRRGLRAGETARYDGVSWSSAPTRRCGRATRAPVPAASDGQADIIRTSSVVFQRGTSMASSASLHTADRIGSSVLDLIGRTPLVRLLRFEREVPGVELWAKVEWQNPGGSVKDRAAARMILDGEASGALTPGKVILDATSGNTGIAYAMVGAARGYKVKLCLPANASPERKMILRALGTELILTDPLEGTDGAIREARRLYAAEPDKYFYPDQYSNESNWRAHYDTTGPEIIE